MASVIMSNADSTRTIKFDIQPTKAIISGDVNRRSIKAEAPVEVAREFCGGLMEKGWENVTPEGEP